MSNTKHRFIESLIELGLNNYYDNHTYTYHMCKMALCAEKDGFSKEIIIACFLFRIGYLVELNSNTYCSNVKDYGKLGRNYLDKMGLGTDKIVGIVSNYINIKRYQLYKENNLLDNNDSKFNNKLKELIIYNGGRMNAKEAVEYEKKTMMGLLMIINYYEGLEPTYINLDEDNCKSVALGYLSLI